MLTESAMQRRIFLEKHQSESLAVGLHVNLNTSKAMINKHAESALFIFQKATLEQGEEYNYLGEVMCGHKPRDGNPVQNRYGLGCTWPALPSNEK